MMTNQSITIDRKMKSSLFHLTMEEVIRMNQRKMKNRRKRDIGGRYPWYLVLHVLTLPLELGHIVPEHHGHE